MRPRKFVPFLVVLMVVIISIAVIATAAPQAGTLTSGEPGMPGLTRELEIFPDNLSHADISGSRIVYSDYRDGNWDIFLFNHTSGREYQLTNNTFDQMNPCISCDLVAWYDNSTGVWDLVLLKLNGEDATYQVCTGPVGGPNGCPAGMICPQISPGKNDTTRKPDGNDTPSEPDNCSCTADFVWIPQDPGVGDPVNFTDRTTVSGGCKIESWAWIFGDGGTANEQNPGHAYTRPGVYNVTLDVTLRNGTLCNVTQDINVSSTQADACSCTADFTWDPQAPPAGDAINFTDTTTVTGGCDIQSWAWAFGDGATATEQNPGHSFAQPGTYTVRLDATLADGTTCNVSKDIPVSPPPQAPCSCEASITRITQRTNVNQPINFAGSVEISEGCTATVSSMAWDFGDGTTDTGTSVRHMWDRGGTYTITLVVTLSDGTTCQTTMDVDIVVPPQPCSCTVSITQAVTEEGYRLSGQVDIQGDCTVTDWAWNFGDGTTGNGQEVTHTYTSEGVRRVTLVVTLSDGRTCQATTLAGSVD